MVSIPSVDFVGGGNPDYMDDQLLPEHAIGSSYVLVPIPGQSESAYLVQVRYAPSIYRAIDRYIWAPIDHRQNFI